MNKLIIVSLFHFAAINAVLGCDFGDNCWIDIAQCTGEVVDVDNDADITKPVREIEVKNINEVTTLTPSKYVDINLNEGKTHVIITLTDKFKEYAENNDDPEFSIKVQLVGCNNKDTFFIFRVNEKYNNPPVFLDAPYNKPVGTPILPSAEIKGISARDIDIGTRRLQFTVCDDKHPEFYFTDSVQNTNNKKIYDTILKTRTVLELEDDITLKICVTDDHNKPETDTTTVTLQIDKTVSKTPNPVFQEPVYKGVYDMRTGLLGEIPTALNNAKYEIKTARLTDFSEKFELKVDTKNIIISQKSDSLISEEDLLDKKYILMILEAEYEGADKVGKTVILFDIEGNTVTTTTTTASTTLSTTITDCPPCTTLATTTATECPTTTVTECPTTTVTECPTTTVTECPTTTTTECPMDCTECPTTTVTECPTTTTTECPMNCTECPTSTVTECPTTTVTECPTTTVTEYPTSPCTECPTTNTTECPPCSSTTECPTTTATECPTTTVTECPTTTTTECPMNCSECPTTTVTECPTTTTATECPMDCTECPTTTVTECPTTTVTECPTTSTTECPMNCSECPTTTVTEYSTTTVTECPTTTATECPIDCTECPTTTVTECPSTTATATECPPCSTSTAVTSTDITSTTTTSPTCTECPICPGTTTTTSPGDTTTGDSGTITSTSTTAQPVIVKYDYSDRNFAIKSKQIGKIDMIVATSTIREDIEYHIDTTSTDEVILSNLAYDMNTGELYITSFIETGIYHFTLIATGKISKSEGKINIKLTSDAASNCNGEPILADSLVVKRVLEDKTEQIAVQEHEDYELKITGEKSKWIEERDGGIWIVEPDREDPSLGSMITPQVSVIVEARKKNTGTSTNYYNATLMEFVRNTYNARDQSENCIHISSIKNSPVRMTVVVIIEDINDNDPEFDNSNPVVVGYPNSQLAEFIAPAYITKVTATDKDSGKNAQIKYSIAASRFIVDPYTGIIYPGSGAFDKETEYEFKVIATDEDGAGRSAEHAIKVKILDEKHVSVLKLKNVAYSDLNEYIAKLSKDIGKNVQCLMTTAMPTAENTKKLQKSVFAGDEKNSLLKIVAYALDNENEPILATEFKKLIEGTGLEAYVEEYEIPSGQVNPPSLSCENAGFIAAVSALSVLLALVIIGVILVYVFFIRPKPGQGRWFKKRESVTPTTSKNYKTRNSHLHSSVADRRPTGFPAEFKPDDIEAAAEIVKPKKPENNEKDEGVYHSETSSNEDSDRKKSIVKFDKNVTEIEIEKF